MKNNREFKWAVIISVILHGIVLVLLITSPSLPRPTRKGMIYYLPLNLVGPPGGGGGGGGGAPGAKASSPSRPSLRDLTAVQKKTAETPSSSLRYPVDKKPASKKTTEKKTVISKPQAESEITKQETEGSGLGPAGMGLRIGVGPGPLGPGTGGWGSGHFDFSTFPFIYYLQIIQDKISNNWFTSLIDPGASGQFQCMIFFKILRDGRITDLQIEISSGSRSFDLSALRAVQNASPFPPLPREFEGEYLGVHLIFEHFK